MIVTTCPECNLTLTDDMEKCPKCSTVLDEEKEVALEKPKVTKTRKKITVAKEEKTKTTAAKTVPTQKEDDIINEVTSLEETKAVSLKKESAEATPKKATTKKKVTVEKNITVTTKPAEPTLEEMTPEEILEDIIEEAEKENICETCFAPVEEGQNFCQLCGSNVQSMREQIAPALPKTDKEANKWIAALGYFFFFFPIICGYYRKSKFAKFHAKQSLLLFISSVAFFIFLVIFRNIIVSLMSPTLSLEMSAPIAINHRFFSTHGFGFIFYYYLYGMVNAMHLLPFALMIVGIINALQGKKKPLPLIGRLMKFTRENLNFIKKPAEKK